jgi:Tetratricopeptide repeat
MRPVLVSILLLGCFASPIATAETPTHKAKTLFEEGLKHYNVGDYKEALQSFKDGYFAKPDPIFLFNMGQCYRQLGDPDGAQRQYRAYLREAPDTPSRPEVERFIAAAEAQIQARAANAPPTGVIEPPTGRATPDEALQNQVAPVNLVPTRTEVVVSQPLEPKRRRWLWPVVGSVIGVVVVVGVAVGVSFAIPNNASVKAGTDPSYTAVFH